LIRFASGIQEWFAPIVMAWLAMTREKILHWTETAISLNQSSSSGDFDESGSLLTDIFSAFARVLEILCRLEWTEKEEFAKYLLFVFRVVEQSTRLVVNSLVKRIEEERGSHFPFDFPSALNNWLDGNDFSIPVEFPICSKTGIDYLNTLESSRLKIDELLNIANINEYEDYCKKEMLSVVIKGLQCLGCDDELYICTEDDYLVSLVNKKKEVQRLTKTYPETIFIDDYSDISKLKLKIVDIFSLKKIKKSYYIEAGSDKKKKGRNESVTLEIRSKSELDYVVQNTMRSLRISKLNYINEYVHKVRIIKLDLPSVLSQYTGFFLKS
jgi:hypothetical protein